ncbi:MAG: glycosyltransferase, partial [Verrucomicrobia bacterium 21-51-4]
MEIIPISVLIAVKNSATRIIPVLKSIQWADEIVLVDSHSSDALTSIASQYAATIIQFESKSPWPKKRNWALANHAWKHPWIFVLDDDEVLPQKAYEELRSIVNDPKPPHEGYWVNRRFWFIDRWLNHCYSPNWNLRLFQLGKGAYEQLSNAETQSGDAEVHEHIIVKGSTAKLHFIIDHYAFPSIDSFVEKHNRYSNWEALLDSQGSWGSGKKSWKRTARKYITHLPFRPL